MDVDNLDVLPALLQAVYQSVDCHHYVTLDVFFLVTNLTNCPVETQNLLELDTDGVEHLVDLGLQVISWLEWERLTIDLGEGGTKNLDDVLNLRLGAQQNIILLSPTFDGAWLVLIISSSESIESNMLNSLSLAPVDVGGVGENQNTSAGLW